MKYLEYERQKKRYSNIQKIYEAMLSERENIIRFDGVKDTGDLAHVNMVIDGLRQSLNDRRELVTMLKGELMASNDPMDVVYRMRILERQKVGKIARCVNYSDTQVYRMLNQISDTLKTLDRE